MTKPTLRGPSCASSKLSSWSWAAALPSWSGKSAWSSTVKTFTSTFFFHRRLRRLVAIELKLGRFKAAHKGQMELYLAWLNQNERQPGEEPPIGLILCAEASREQVELLQMHQDGITVAEYWTELPPKAELERQLHQALQDARERLTRRGVLLRSDLEE